MSLGSIDKGRTNKLPSQTTIQGTKTGQTSTVSKTESKTEVRKPKVQSDTTGKARPSRESKDTLSGLSGKTKSERSTKKTPKQKVPKEIVPNPKVPPKGFPWIKTPGGKILPPNLQDPRKLDQMLKNDPNAKVPLHWRNSIGTPQHEMVRLDSVLKYREPSLSLPKGKALPPGLSDPKKLEQMMLEDPNRKVPLHSLNSLGTRQVEQVPISQVLHFEPPKSVSARKGAPGPLQVQPGEKVNGKKVSDMKFDGGFVGEGGIIYSSKTKLTDIPTIKPKDGQPTGLIIQVNGITTNAQKQAMALQEVANKTGKEVIGIHNGTSGFVKDLLECGTDKMNVGNNGAVKTMRDLVYNQLTKKPPQDVHLMGHSQGGIITSRALRDVRNQLISDNKMTKQQAKKLMEQHVKVETFGSGSVNYPSGPKYVHYINKEDPIPMKVGGGGSLHDKGKGENSVIHRFSEGSGIGAHNFVKVYVQHRQPFEDMFRTDKKLPEIPMNVGDSVTKMPRKH